jgi:hypothetical protein
LLYPFIALPFALKAEADRDVCSSILFIAVLITHRSPSVHYGIIQYIFLSASASFCSAFQQYFSSTFQRRNTVFPHSKSASSAAAVAKFLQNK